MPTRMNETTQQRMERYLGERNELRRQARRAERDGGNLDAFKARVLEVATRVAKEQGWCEEGLEKELRGLGIEVPQKTVTVVVEVVLAPTGFTEDGGKQATAERRLQRVLGQRPGAFRGITGAKVVPSA